MSPRSPTDPNRGDTWLGRYRVIAELARGGMAAVFLALGDLGRGPEVVAIKQIHAHLAHDPDFVAMLMDEARIVSMLKHPNVVEVVDYQLGDSGADNFIVMEYVAGEALSLVMRSASQRGFQVGYSVAASVAANVAAALHAAHKLRNPAGELLDIVHRDVTPQNILVGWDGAVKLTDFGVAKAVGRLQRTQPGEIKGKLAYMAPEHAFGRPVDRRSDVYSLGVVLYELALNRRLFGGKTDAETIRNVMQGVVTPPRSIDPHFPPSLEEIILAMLAADPAQRFQTAGALERALRGFVRSMGEGHKEERRGELVREVDPARFQAKYDLIQRELARGVGVPPQGGAGPSRVRTPTPAPVAAPSLQRRATEPPPVASAPPAPRPPAAPDDAILQTYQSMRAQPQAYAPPIAPPARASLPPDPALDIVTARDDGSTVQADFTPALRAQIAATAHGLPGPHTHHRPLHPPAQPPSQGHNLAWSPTPEVSPYVLGPTAPSAAPSPPIGAGAAPKRSRKALGVVIVGVVVIVVSVLIILDHLLL